MSAGTIYKVVVAIESGIIIFKVVASSSIKAFLEIKKLEKYIL